MTQKLHGRPALFLIWSGRLIFSETLQASFTDITYERHCLQICLFKQESFSLPTSFSHVKIKIKYILTEHESSQNTLVMDCTGKGRWSAEALYLRAIWGTSNFMSIDLCSQFKAAGRLDRWPPFSAYMCSVLNAQIYQKRVLEIRLWILEQNYLKKYNFI
jgi:hypothetical protein